MYYYLTAFHTALGIGASYLSFRHNNSVNPESLFIALLIPQLYIPHKIATWNNKQYLSSELKK